MDCLTLANIIETGVCHHEKIALSIALLSSLLLSACATYTTAAYEQILDTFIGDTEQQIISVWGVPDRTFESGENKYFVYTRQGNLLRSGKPRLLPALLGMAQALRSTRLTMAAHRDIT